MWKSITAALFLSAIALGLWLLGRQAPEHAVSPRSAGKVATVTPVQPIANEADNRSEPSAARHASLSPAAPRTGDGHVGTAQQALSPTEASLLTQGMVNDNAHERLKSKSFDDFVVSLQAASTTDAGERSAAYRIEVEDSLRRYPELGLLTRFACGHTFCAGSINVGQDHQALETWTGTLQQQATLPIPTFSHRLIRQPDGSFEARFLFTTRGSGGFISSRKPG